MHFATRSIYRLHSSLRPCFFFPMFKAAQKWIISNTFFYSEKSESFHRTHMFNIYTLSDLGDSSNLIGSLSQLSARR